MSDSQEEWKPNQGYLDTLLAMGIPHNVAMEALFCTGNNSAESAVDYVFNTPESGDCKRPNTPQGRKSEVTEGDEQQHSSEDDDYDAQDTEGNYYKMTFVVNTSLKMGIGKVAAQVGHACLGLYRDMQKHSLIDILKEWECIGEKKIVLKGIDHNHLQELYQKAETSNIPAYLVSDAGHTQIPAGSVTVLSLFGLEEDVDKITGKLSLL